MTRFSGTPRAAETEWKVELLRLTTFHSATLLVNKQGWWNELTGLNPETVVNKPKGGELAVIGRFNDWPLVLQVQQQPEGRVDWVAGGLTEIVERSKAPLLSVQLPMFIELMGRWLQANCPETKRLAFGAFLNLDVQSREEGFKTLSNFLPFDLDPEASDFLYHINRKRPSGILDGLVINRLMQWSVASRQQGRVGFPSGSGQLESERNDPIYHCRLELDLNTVPASVTPLPHDKLKLLLDEMQHLCLEIVREGDVP